MWIKFCIYLLLSGLIDQVKCVNIPYSDMYLPDGIDGFLCGREVIWIEYARQSANKMMKSYFYDKYFHTFPKLFEDTHLFNVKSDILLSWPAKPSGIIYIRNPGKYRLIINLRGQIMGVVIIDHAKHSKNISFKRCNPVHSSIPEGNTESRLLDEFWSLAYPIHGYKCGSKYFPQSTVKSGNDLDSNYYFQKALETIESPIKFKKYRGDQFTGSDLRVYPLHHSLSSKPGSGSQGLFRVVFEMKDRKFKGITDLKDGAKCVTLWDLSSASPDTIYRPSSILNMEGLSEKFWPATCFGHRFKYKTIWLFIEFASKDWSKNRDDMAHNFPIVREDRFLFWPVRNKETHDINTALAFAIGYDTKEDTYGLYRARVKNGFLNMFQQCIDLPLKDIRSLQRRLSSVIQL
ncbi:putative candidate secreted effector protein [Blumeria hordei DH14]|uniref:Putative candidate secreted effector protein n=1 Tax=Blumeria graminis f. sp. hordei (strain DH14) TaxID=546991 RepID=N1J617_BLUG1|nr:putative candidate secreted effector protein [Blumeria hordei DH14]